MPPLSFIRFDMINILKLVINEVNLLKVKSMNINLLSDQKSMSFFKNFSRTLLMLVSV